MKKAETGLSPSGFFMVVAGTFGAWRLTVGITRPPNKAVEVARTVAPGNLTSTIEVDTADETGQLLSALKDMNGNLVRMVSAVRADTVAIATATG